MGSSYTFNLKKAISALLLLIIFCVSSAMAEKAVHLDFYSGADAMALVEKGGINSVSFNGQQYQLDDSYCSYREEFMMYGGKTFSLYEMSVPMTQQYRFSEGTDVKLGRITINPPTTMTLYVFSGDHDTGMYMMRDPIELSSAYQEDVYATHDQSGRLQKIDRVYLYQYEEAGETKHKAMTMYIDYENYDAAPAEDSQIANAAVNNADDSASAESDVQTDAPHVENEAPMNASPANPPEFNEAPAEQQTEDAAGEVSSAPTQNQTLHLDSLTIYSQNIQVMSTATEAPEAAVEDAQESVAAPVQEITEAEAIHESAATTAEPEPTEGPAATPETAPATEQSADTEETSDTVQSPSEAAQSAAFPWQWVAIAACALALIGIIVLAAVLMHHSKKAKADDTATRQRFYRLTDIDAQQKNATPASYNNNVTLESICQQFRDYAASQLHLYYSLDMIRTFIASFAASRLIIMQGISGTGKTSLAYAFGKFVENDSTIIPVQPSWRDRSDLLGYFNEFTKRFNETELLSTIYEAGYNDDVYIAVLDEMNIARVEYYFAEFLSILEMPSPEEWVVNIVPDHWALDPQKLEGGKLHLPRNMWYIGTANNDDSTFAISDKVYDRAMILDIDSRAERFTAPTTESLKLSADTFEKLLKESASRYRISDENLEKINQLDAYIIQHLRVAFGNRIMNQFYRFVPAYMACGGEELRGIDYILCKKVLRKFENQNMAYIRDEIDDLCDYLDQMFGRGAMSISLEYLRRLKKMG